jgi:hypothetical protein
MKKKLLALYLLFSVFGIQAQSFYDETAIQEIRINFSQPDWETLLNTEQQTTQNYIPAESVVINGTVFNNVGVKYKGNSSFEPFLPKNPFHIELDTYQNQDYQGYTDIKLSNVVFDPSFIRETLSYSMLRNYMAAPEANYANVYVNNNLIGLYTNVESVSKKFVKKHFYSDTNAFFDCSPVEGAGNQPLQDLPALIYWGPNVDTYDLAYRMKSETGWEDLITLINTLNNNTANIESHLDVDRVLWMHAFNNIMVNLDSYIGVFNQNYYLYKDDNGRFNPVIWDLNMSLGVFADLGTFVLPNTTAKKQMNHLQHMGDNTFPLLAKLLAIPKYKKMYLAHYNTILQEQFVGNAYLPKAQQLRSLITASVQNDPNKLNSFAAYQQNLNNDVTTNFGLVAPGITNIISGRTTFLTALPDFTAARPVIANIQPSVANPVVGTQFTMTAQVTNTNANSVVIGYRNNLKDIFTKVQMLDDGNHNDGAASDNVYGASITISNAYMQYYIYAENNTIGAFSPERAEYEFHTLHATYPTLNAGELAINEIMAQNISTIADAAGQFEDWIELHNNTSNTISLDNLYLTDNPANLQKWQFPSELTIEPNGYLVIWADEDLEEDGLHADFKLSASGENVILSYPNGDVIDSVTFGVQAADVSYARIPNGTGSFVSNPPTFNTNNENLSTGGFTAAFNGSAWPNPMRDELNISASQDMESIELYNLLGQRVLIQQASAATAKLRTDNLENGVYLVRISGHSESVTFKVLKQ